MKKPDLNNFKQIDYLKHFIDQIVIIRTNDEEKKYKINSKKIDWNRIDNLTDYELLSEDILLEKILDEKLFIESDFSIGFEDVSVRLNKIKGVENINF